MQVEQATLDESRQSSSGLSFKLHPLVLINISDHHNRIKANVQASSSSTGGAGSRVIGCLLGQQNGRVVDISNSFEANYEVTPDGPVIDNAFLTKKQEQYKQVFPQLDVVGWYATGTGVEPYDMQIHRKIMEINESPVFMLLNPKIDYTRKDLPVALYETELHVIDDVPTFIFVQSKYTLETSEAERIGVNQVAKISKTGKASGTDQLTSHLSGLHSAIKMFSGRMSVLTQYLEAMAQGQLPLDHSLLRQVSALLAGLPASGGEAFSQEFLLEYNDALLTMLLSSVTKGCSAVSEVVDKYSVAYEKPVRRKPGHMI